MNKIVNLQSAQASESDLTRILFEGERSRKFYQLLCEAFDANDALLTTAQHFPDPITGPGLIDPSLAVESYSGTIRVRLNQVLAMIDGDDIEIPPVSQESPAPETSRQRPDKVVRATRSDIHNRFPVISVELADDFREKLYEIKRASCTMQEVLFAQFNSDHSLSSITALHKEIHHGFDELEDMIGGAHPLQKVEKV